MSSRLHKQQNLELFHHVVGKNSADIALVLDLSLIHISEPTRPY